MNVILFGPKATAPDDDAQKCEVIAFLRGDPVEWSAMFARALLEEFSAQEAVRKAMRDKMRELVKTLKVKADALEGDLQIPYRESEQYDAGYRAGRYTTATEAAQAAQTALNEALEEIAV